MSNTEEFVNLLHKEMEQFIDEGYAKLDQQEYEMRELGLINYGDSSYYIQNPDEYEKDRKICELENANLRNELAELKQKAIVPKEDKFVIVSNAWKHNKKYGIAKVQQIMTDHYILQTNDYLGSYVPCVQYGKFKTLEEAEQKLAEIKGEK